jgi:hypothetical protein
VSRLTLTLFCICLYSNVTAKERTDKDEELFERCAKEVDQLCPKNSFDRFDRSDLRQCIVDTLPNLSAECASHVERGLRRGNLNKSQTAITKDET